MVVKEKMSKELFKKSAKFLPENPPNIRTTNPPTSSRESSPESAPSTFRWNFLDPSVQKVTRYFQI